jgi:hypothetical protein
MLLVPGDMVIPLDDGQCYVKNDHDGRVGVLTSDSNTRPSTCSSSCH